MQTGQHFVTVSDGRRWVEHAADLTRGEAERIADGLLGEPGITAVRIWTAWGYCVREWWCEDSP